MCSWIAILTAIAFACFAIQKGFYETCTMLFNIVIAIYLAVFLNPTITHIAPATASTACNCALTLAATAIGAFLILHVISYIFLTGQFKISFSKISDTIGAAALGFVAGCLLCSFISLLICITPASRNTLVKKMGLSNQPDQANLAHTYWWCTKVNMIASRRDSEHSAEQITSELLKKFEPKRRITPGKPLQPTEPNDMETPVIKEKQPT